jgi:hypothetical protein
MLLWLALASVLDSRVAVGQAAPSVCVTGRDSVATQLQTIKGLVTVYPAQIPAGYNLPYQPTEGVILITDEAICSQALAAYNAPPPATDDVHSVVVLKVGTNRYVVTAPTPPASRILYVVYDTVFAQLVEMVQ